MWTSRTRTTESRASTRASRWGRRSYALSRGLWIKCAPSQGSRQSASSSYTPWYPVSSAPCLFCRKANFSKFYNFQWSVNSWSIRSLCQLCTELWIFVLRRISSLSQPICCLDTVCIPSFIERFTEFIILVFSGLPAFSWITIIFSAEIILESMLICSLT